VKLHGPVTRASSPVVEKIFSKAQLSELNRAYPAAPRVVNRAASVGGAAFRGSHSSYQ
jgi:hypothetical protein